MRKAALGLSLGLVTIALILAHGCFGHDGKRLRVRNNAGEPTETIETYDSLIVSLEGLLEPATHYDFRVTPAGETAPVVGQARLTTDQEGHLPDAILLFDVGQGGVPPGTYDVQVSGPNLDELVTIAIEPPTGPYVYTCDATGAVQNSYGYSDIVYAAGGNFPADTDVQIMAQPDRTEYADGDRLDWVVPPPPPDPNMPPMPPLPGMSVWTARTDADGNLPITELVDFFLFVFPEAGAGFDIVVDLPPLGEFNTESDAVDGHAVVGLTYQVEDVGSDVDSDLACDLEGTYKDTFSTTEDVYAWINPPLQYVVEYFFVDKYVCHHRDEWKDGDPLQDVSGGNEMDGVQSGCINEWIVVVFPAPLPVGDYDVIIDVNQDGVYTQGVDIVDGGSAESIGEIGFKVE